jgi:hypothetical protein
MIDNDSWRGGSRRSWARSGRGALLVVVGTKGPDHGLLEVVHEISRGTLNISFCLGDITAVG